MADIYKSKFTGQEIDDILTNASNATNIEANPSGEATEELTKITIGDITYSIPEGTEGTVVEGNPSGNATVELTKLKIGNIIYSIQQGGGSTQLYRHSIRITKSGSTTYFEGISPHSDAVDFQTLAMGSPDFLIFQVEKCATSWTPNLTSGGDMGIEGYYFISSGTSRSFSFYSNNSSISDTVTPI